ncbi:PAS domain-containing protein [Hymenobacter sp. YC55]|uniref:sensor histidine kinase n=1 Tax=Hymenobacter sp. YC55 TaxID=3034019 RepID=UPI0023F93CD4|nr:PAS domain-containing protein [Hymenobacter sp. YC55]MDF7815074.1 PAS domain-containing protein [Hymenobacter sp. YC55]
MLPTASLGTTLLLSPNLLSVFNAQPGATLLLSPEWQIVGASNDYLAATLTERDLLVGQYIFDAFPDNPETPEANAVTNVRASLAQVLATKQPHDMAPQHYDVPDPAHPGRFVERYWKPRHTPVLDAAGQVHFIIQSVQDITASRLAERQLRESQAREQAALAETERQRAELQRVYEEAPVAMGLLRGPRFVVEWANARMGQIFGRPLAQIIGRPHFDALPDLAGQGFEQVFVDVLETGRTAAFQELLVRIEQAQQSYQGYFNITYQPVYDGPHHITGILCSAFEVTDQVRARRQVEQLNQELETHVHARTQELTATNEQLQRTNVDLDNFIYTASHDLKAPISNLEGLLHALQHELPVQRQVGEIPALLQLMQQAIERFGRTLHHLTAISLLQKEYDRPATPVNLTRVVAEVQLDLAPLVAESGAQVVVLLPEHVSFTLAEKNLRSIVYNLLSNALKYRHPDRVPHIEITYDQQGESHLLAVHDNGLGLDLDRGAERLFAMFQRLHTHVEGSGVGLYMVKRMIENAGGRIEVQSELGQGSTFCVYLPLT